MHDSGLHVLAAPTDTLESVEIDDERLTRILTVARGAYRHVVVDTFPLFDRLIVAVLDYVDAAFVVLDNSVPTVVGCKQFLGLLDRINFAQSDRRIVLNRFERTAGYPSRKQVEAQLGVPIDFLLPASSKVAAGTNIGEPTVLRPGLSNRWVSRCRQLAEHIDRLATRPTSQSRSDAAGDAVLALAGEQ